jgi:hypothetical protein
MLKNSKKCSPKPKTIASQDQIHGSCYLKTIFIRSWQSKSKRTEIDRNVFDTYIMILLHLVLLS